MVKGGVCGKGGGMRGEGGSAWYARPPPLRDTAGQCAGGTHPTGMYSCSFFVRCKLPFLFCLISTNISIL